MSRNDFGLPDDVVVMEPARRIKDRGSVRETIVCVRGNRLDLARSFQSAVCVGTNGDLRTEIVVSRKGVPKPYRAPMNFGLVFEEYF